MAPDRPDDVASASFSADPPASRMALDISLYFSTPCVRTMFAAREASAPKIVVIACALCSSVMSAVALENSSTNFSIDLSSPWESKTFTPSFFIALADSSVGAVSFCSMVFNDVPASEPLTPAFAISDMDVMRSSMGTPAAAKFADACFMPIPRS